MTSGQKVALSLLSAFALFAAFVLSFHTFLFKEMELKFYTQAKIEENVEQLNNISKSYDDYIKKVLEKIETGDDAFLKDVSVRSYYTQNPSEKDVSQRRLLTENLFKDIPGLDGIRIIDKNGKNVHFSTYDNTDVLKQSGISKIYKNYSDIVEDADEIPYEILSKNIKQDSSVLMFDGKTSRVIIAVPFAWIDNIYSGVALFYFKLLDMERELIKQDVLSIGQNMQIMADDNLSGGFVLGVPNSLKNQFFEPVNEFWKSNIDEVLGLQKPEKLFEKDDGTFYVALSSTLKNDNRVVGVYTSDLFEISTELKLLVYICVFISAFLIIFLLFSLKQDPIVVLKHKIKKIQYGVIKEYVDNKEKIEWKNVVNHLKSRQKDLSAEIMKSVNVHSKKKKKELNSFLEKNWDEIFAVIGSNGESVNDLTNKEDGAENVPASVNVSADSDLLREIRNVLNEVLAGVQSESGKSGVKARAGKKKVAVAAPVSSSADDDIEEIEEIEELDDVEEIEDAEEVEELDDVEEIEDAEEVEELDDVEEIEDAEEVEELDDVEEVEDAEEVEEGVGAGQVEELDDVEEVEDAEEVEEGVGAGQVEELDDVEEIEELDDDIEDLEEADEDAELGHINATPAPAFGIWDDEFFKNFTGAFNYEYRPSNNTFFASECFPTVENLFAEELAIGSYVEKKNEFESTPELEIFPIEFYEDEEQNAVKDEVIEGDDISAGEIEENIENKASDIDDNENNYQNVGKYGNSDEIDIATDNISNDDNNEIELSEEVTGDAASEEDLENEDIDDVEELPESVEKQLEENENPVHYSLTSLGESFLVNPPVLDGIDNEN